MCRLDLASPKRCPTRVPPSGSRSTSLGTSMEPNPHLDPDPISSSESGWFVTWRRSSTYNLETSWELSNAEISSWCLVLFRRADFKRRGPGRGSSSRRSRSASRVQSVGDHARCFRDQDRWRAGRGGLAVGACDSASLRVVPRGQRRASGGDDGVSDLRRLQVLPRLRRSRPGARADPRPSHGPRSSQHLGPGRSRHADDRRLQR